MFAHLCKICRVYAALSWVSIIRSGFGTHLNVQNRKMYAMVTLCAFLLQLVLWRCQNTAHFYWCLHTFVKYVECMQHFHEWVSLDRDLAHIWMCKILHISIERKYVECMQHFHEWVWLDRDLAHIWMCRIERCTQWLHSVHSCCNWCSDVVKILHISIGVCTPL